MTTDTKTALLDAAEQVARAQGFDGFSYADLAQQVGIRKASIHHHFPTKDSLCIAMMKRYSKTFEAACTRISKTNGTAATRLDAFVSLYHSALQGGTCLCLCVALSISRDRLSDAVLAEISGFRAMVLSWLTETFSQGTHDGTVKDLAEPALEAAALLALVEGAQVTARAQVDPALFETALSLFRRRLGNQREHRSL